MISLRLLLRLATKMDLVLDGFTSMILATNPWVSIATIEELPFELTGHEKFEQGKSRRSHSSRKKVSGLVQIEVDDQNHRTWSYESQNVFAPNFPKTRS